MLTRMGCLLSLALAAVFGAALCAQQNDVPAVTIDRTVTSGGGLVVNATDGWEFSVVSPVTVTSLGVWDHKNDGLNTEIPVGIWDDDARLLVSAAVPAGTRATALDGFRYVRVKPLRLLPGRNYVIGAAYTPRTRENISSGSANTFYSDGAIRWVRRRRVIRREGLAFPQPGDLPGIVPGGFGPNFLVAKAETPRQYYRAQKVDDARRYITVNLPEADDESHKREFVTLVSLFARPDGRLTQILVNGAPLGTGEEALAELNATVTQLANNMQKTIGVTPNVRIAALSSVRFADLLRVADAVSGRRVNPRVRYTRPQKIEFSTLMDTRTPHVRVVPSDRFVDRGEYVEDTWTGLLWQKDGVASGKMNFYDAADYAAGRKLGGMSGWRVPTIEELASIFPAVDAPFVDTPYTPHQCCAPPHEYESYWTSQLAKGEDYAYVYHWYAKGGPNNCYASRNYVYVRCVHDPLARSDATRRPTKPRPERKSKAEPEAQAAPDKKTKTGEQGKAKKKKKKKGKRRNKAKKGRKKARQKDRS